MITLTCMDFPGDCCNSCHDDEAEGFGDLIEVDNADGTLFARVCCRKLDAAYARQEGEE